MSRWSLALLLVAACSSPTHTRTGYAADPIYHDEISDCVGKVDCSTLCIDVFKLDTTDIVDRVKILHRDQYGASIVCEFEGATEDFSLDVNFDDWGDDDCDFDCDDPGSYDDGSGDGSCDDGSCDDGSDDGSDDSGSDSGSDDSGDPPPDDGSRIAPHHTHVMPSRTL